MDMDMEKMPVTNRYGGKQIAYYVFLVLFFYTGSTHQQMFQTYKTHNIKKRRLFLYYVSVNDLFSFCHPAYQKSEASSVVINQPATI